MKLKESMRNKFIVAIIVMIFSAITVEAQNVWSADNGDGTFTNPILWGDWPDPDVIRVKDKFYMVSTSMHYVPGCPILESSDLVNWKMVSYAVQRYDEDPRYDMKGGELYLNGAWASSIRHHNGLFYVAFCTPYGWGTEKGNFSICTAKDAKGPWKRTIFPEYMYDPGLLFDDDGKVYVFHGQGSIYVTELSQDAMSVKGKNIEIWNQRFKNANELGGGFAMEGAHAYKIDGKYYITCPAGGTEGWQICLRADNIYGPYEHKLIINDASSYPPNGLHQGGMVQLKNGDWWFIIMQDRGPIGRTAHLVPVQWKDGWPILGSGGKDLITYPKPACGVPYSKTMSPATSDEFASPRLGLQWQWNHNPDNNRWSIEDRKGFIRLRASLAPSLDKARNTLTQRVQGPSCEGSVAIELAGLKDGNTAGFGIFESPYAYVAVQKKAGRSNIVMCNNGKIIEQIENFTGQRIYIRARVTDKDFTARFYYSTDSVNFSPIGDVLKMGLGLPWTANRFALFNFTTTPQGEGGYADFDWFRFTNK